MKQTTHLYHIGQMVKQAREMAGYSQAELAEMAMIRQATISDIEQGKSNFEINTLVRIASALNLVIDITLSPQ